MNTLGSCCEGGTAHSQIHDCRRIEQQKLICFGFGVFITRLWLHGIDRSCVSSFAAASGLFQPVLCAASTT